jgi:N-acyl-D-amino-acid deacylase
MQKRKPEATIFKLSKLVDYRWNSLKLVADPPMKKILAFLLLLAAQAAGSAALAQVAEYDVIIRGGTIYDGTGRPGVVADIAIMGDSVAAIGDLSAVKAKTTIDAKGLAVAPGFINMLSWATTSLITDGKSQSDIRQGVTLEIFGEGVSQGPLNESMRRDLIASQRDEKYEVPWTTLAEYLKHLETRGVSCNVASFVGATTVRIHEVGYANRKATPEELDRMRAHVRKAMQEGALGVGSSLIYAPAFYAPTEELIELAKVAAEYDGMYISHIRSEGNRLLEGVDELIRIAKESGARSEIYHLKAAGERNWIKHDEVIKRIETARARGLEITADMYNYPAASTGLDATMPPWVQEGGYRAWADRLRDAKTRDKVAAEMRAHSDSWENLLLAAGKPENVLLVSFKNDNLKHLTGKSLGEVAKQRGKSAEETAMDLVIEDGSRVECVYFIMDEKNVRKNVALPWVSFCSDSASLAPEGVFLKSMPHPRAYGSFSRLLGKYVREEKVIPLETAIYKLAGLPAKNLGIKRRGKLENGYFADVVVFDPATVGDKATFDNPHQYAVGMKHVFVNGAQVLKDGEHTGAKPGRVVNGPGYYRNPAHRPEVVVTEEAKKAHAATYVWDGHNDLPWESRQRASLSFEKLDISKPQPEIHTDIERLKKGNVGAQFWSVYVPVSTIRKGESLLITLEQIEFVHAMCKRYPETFELALTVDDVERIQKSGKIASLIGMEGGHSIENSLQNLRRLYDLGARYMTLTHSESLDWAESSSNTKKEDRGLTEFGQEVVREMNKLGMLIDISHVSIQTMKDAIRVSQAPVIFSHSSARSVADHPRNVPDDVLKLTAKDGGIVMVNFFSGFIDPEAAKIITAYGNKQNEIRAQSATDEDYERAWAKWRTQNPIPKGSIHDVVDHIDHIVRIAGVDHVGIGSDFDGVTSLPTQLEDVSTYPRITAELLRRGYTADEIDRIMRRNILRVMRAAEKVKADLAKP